MLCTKLRRPHPDNARICHDAALAEEDEGVQLHRGTPRELRIVVAQIQVVSQRMQAGAVAGLCWQRRQLQGSCQQPVYHHVCVSVAKWKL